VAAGQQPDRDGATAFHHLSPLSRASPQATHPTAPALPPFTTFHHFLGLSPPGHHSTVTALPLFTTFHRIRDFSAMTAS
jgi:hypothetical protein